MTRSCEIPTRWWGWGDINKTYPVEERPTYIPYLEEKLGLDVAEGLEDPAANTHTHIHAQVSTTKTPESESKLADESGQRREIRFILDDFTVIAGGTKYRLPDKHYKAVEFIAKSMKESDNPWVAKEAVYEEADAPFWANNVSVRGWFKKSGGDPE